MGLDGRDMDGVRLTGHGLDMGGDDMNWTWRGLD